MKRIICAVAISALALPLWAQAPAVDEAKAVEKGPEVHMVYGQVVKLQPEKQAIVVANDEDKKEIVIKTTQETTIWADYDKVDYAKIAPQDYVEIEYTGGEGDYQANWVEIYRNTQ